MNKRILSNLYLAVFAAGALTGMALFGLSTWANAEAFFYGFDTVSGKNRSDLHCPVFVTASEQATASMTVRNPTERDVQATIRADISSPGTFRSYNERITVEAGQARTLRWQVSAGDVVLRRFIFLKAYRYASYPLPTVEMTCGMVFVNMERLRGEQLFWLLVSVSLLGMLGGLFLWRRANPDPFGWLLSLGRAMLTMVVLVALGIVTSLVGWWIPGLLLFVVCLLLVIVLTAFVATRTQTTI